MAMTERKVTLFDVDNTLVRGFSVFHFADFLQTESLYPSMVRQIMQKDYDEFVLGRSDYRKFAIDVVDHFYLGLEGLTEIQVVAAGEKFTPQYRAHLLPYSQELVEIMNSESLTVAVSGAPKEAFGPLGRSLGIDITRSSLLEGEIVNGIFTGRTKINTALDDQKRRVVAAMGGDFNLSYSFAFGDSIHDLPLLEAVGTPFVVRRDKDLENYATTNGWAIVDEQNMLDTVREKLAQIR